MHIHIYIYIYVYIYIYIYITLKSFLSFKNKNSTISFSKLGWTFEACCMCAIGGYVTV